MHKSVSLGILVCLSLLSGSLMAQNQEKLFGGDATDAKFRKNVFVEGLGNGLLISANYDMRFKRGASDGLGFRVGIGGGSVEGYTSNNDYINGNVMTFPLSVNYLAGKRRSYFEAGLGITPVFVNADLAIFEDEIYSGKGWGAAGFINVGYRFQPIRNGVMFRLDWTPAITSEGFFPGFFGASLDYSFQ